MADGDNPAPPPPPSGVVLDPQVYTEWHNQLTTRAHGIPEGYVLHDGADNPRGDNQPYVIIHSGERFCRYAFETDEGRILCQMKKPLKRGALLHHVYKHFDSDRGFRVAVNPTRTSTGKGGRSTAADKVKIVPFLRQWYNNMLEQTQEFNSKNSQLVYATASMSTLSAQPTQRSPPRKKLKTTGEAPASTQSSPGSYLTQAEVEKLVADAEKYHLLMAKTQKPEATMEKESDKEKAEQENNASAAQAKKNAAAKAKSQDLEATQKALKDNISKAQEGIKEFTERVTSVTEKLIELKKQGTDIIVLMDTVKAKQDAARHAKPYDETANKKAVQHTKDVAQPLLTIRPEIKTCKAEIKRCKRILKSTKRTLKSFNTELEALTNSG